MGFVHGKNTFLSVNGVDLSTYIDSVEVTDGNTIHKVTTFGPITTREAKASGLGDGKITVKGTFNDDIAAPRKVLEPLMDSGLLVAYVLRHRGVGSGLPQKSGSCIVAQYNESISVNDMIKFTAELEMSGARSVADQP